MQASRSDVLDPQQTDLLLGTVSLLGKIALLRVTCPQRWHRAVTAPQPHNSCLKVRSHSLRIGRTLHTVSETSLGTNGYFRMLQAQSLSTALFRLVHPHSITGKKKDCRQR